MVWPSRTLVLPQIQLHVLDFRALWVLGQLALLRMSLTLEEIVLFALGGCHMLALLLAPLRLSLMLGEISLLALGCQMLALLLVPLRLSLMLCRHLFRVSHVNAEVVEDFDNCVRDFAANALCQGEVVRVSCIAR